MTAPPWESLLFALALAVAISPELLPAIIEVGARDMAAHGAIVRRLSSIENLGSELAIVFVVRTRLPLLKSRPGTLLLVSALAVSALALALPWLPGRDWCEFVPLPVSVVATLLAITAAYAAASELAKRRFGLP